MTPPLSQHALSTMADHSDQLQLGINVNDVQVSATGNWCPLGDNFVKCYQVFSLNWGLSLQDQQVALAPYGGPVAVLVPGRKASEGLIIDIYTMAGRKMATIQFEGGRLAGFGWTASESLMSVFEDGTITVHGLNGDRIFSKQLSREMQHSGVAECKFFHTSEGNSGLAIMTNKFQFFVVSNSDRPKDEIRLKALADLPTAGARPTCWAVLPQGNNVYVVAVIDTKLFILQPFEAIPVVVACKKDPAPRWIRIAISTNGKQAALIDREGYLWAGSSDFRSPDIEFDTQSSSKVMQMEWSANDFVAVLFEKLLFLKGFGKHWCKLPSLYPCVMLPEVDGIRIMTNNSCEFLHKVSTASLQVLRVGSLSAGALLNDSFKEYQGEESHKADEFIRYVKDKLVDAVKQCLDAASEEFDPKVQQSLLMSANFGKGFLGPEITQEIVDKFTDTCRQLRVLNTVRHEIVGIPITYRQFLRLSPGVLIDRLINREQYPLALATCNYMKVPAVKGEAKVLRQWAIGKVLDMSLKDDDVARIILEKFMQSSVVISFAEIARFAKERKRNRLVFQLLEHEVLVSDQVKMLMEMDEANKALDKAIDSGDAQLVYEVLEELKKSEDTGHFLKTFIHQPVAAALYKKHFREVNRESLINLYDQEGDSLGAGIEYLIQFYIKKGSDDGIIDMSLLIEAHKRFSDGLHPFHQKVTEEQEKLLKAQEDLKASGIHVVGASLFDTVYECVKRQHLKKAEQLKKTFKMAESLYWWAKLRGLADIPDFEEVERFSKQKKSPIGYEPFAEICLERSRYTEAIKYIPKASPENRSALYMRAGDFRKAAEAAFSERDVNTLDEILMKTGRQPDVTALVQQMKSRLGAT